MSSAVLLVGEALGVLGARSRLSRAASLEVGVGGAELNVAIGLRRLGVRSIWLGRLGTDGLGQRVRRELRGEDVEVMAIEDPHPTGLLLKERDGVGRTLVTYHRAGSAGSRLNQEDLASVPWAHIALLHVTGITPALSDSAAAAIEAAVWMAHDHGVPVSFDVNHRRTLWGERDPRSVYRALARRSDVVFAGTEEAAFLLDDAAPAADEDALAQQLSREYHSEVVLKLGERGAVAAVDRRVLRVPPVPTAVVDTVGAGDAFVAGYLAERLRGCDLPQRLATATAAGAAACRSAGDWEGAIYRDELDAGESDPVVR
ncbi:MAG: sugar kinase [Leifsonia sp.]